MIGAEGRAFPAAAIGNREAGHLRGFNLGADSLTAIADLIGPAMVREQAAMATPRDRDRSGVPLT
jgi:hypothetical protein